MQYNSRYHLMNLEQPQIKVNIDRLLRAFHLPFHHRAIEHFFALFSNTLTYIATARYNAHTFQSTMIFRVAKYCIEY